LFGVCHPKLTAEERVVCLARAAIGMVPHEIAALLGVPEATVNARLTSAKKTMRQPGGGLGPVADADRAAREALVHTTIAEPKRGAKGDDAQAVSALLAARVNQAFA